jgi:O-antigen/teichoic acid export membrane protein
MTSVMRQETGYYTTSRIRKNLRYFISGRVVGALGTFIATVLVVRHLSVTEYGVFTTALGSSIVCGLVFGLGIERLIPRYLSEFRSEGDMRAVALLSWMFLLARILLLVPAFLLIYGFWDLIAAVLKTELDTSVFWLVIAYIGAFLLGKQSSDTLQAILSHRAASFGFMADALIRVAVLGFLAWRGELSLKAALSAYAAGALAGALVCLWGMHRHFAAERDASSSTNALSPTAVAQYGWHAYLHNLGGILLTPQALRIICASMLGATGVAALGFAQSMTEFVRRYLPVNFLISMIEPIFISRYRADKDFGALDALVSVIFKINLFVLAPLVSWLAFSGEGVLALMTGGKYLDQLWLLTGLLILLAFESHRTLIHLVVMAIDETWLLVMSQFWPLAMLAVLLVLIGLHGLAGFLAGLSGISAFVNLYLVYRLRQKGYPYRPDWKNIARICLNAAIAGGVGAVFNAHMGGWQGSLLAAAAVGAVYLGLGFVRRSFSATEKELIDRLIGKPLWVW